MSAQLQTKRWTEAEYWAFEETSPVKHEFINGQLYAMAGGTLPHANICLNVAAAAKGRLRGKPCNAATSELKVKVEATGDSFYPDASIHCPPSRFVGKGNHTLLTPSVLFEVLSDSTKKIDRENKMLFYEKIESLNRLCFNRCRTHLHRAFQPRHSQRRLALASLHQAHRGRALPTSST